MRKYLDLAAACALMLVVLVLAVPYIVCDWCLSHIIRLAAKHGHRG